MLDRTGFFILLGIIVFGSIIFFPPQANAVANNFNFVTSNIAYQSAIGTNGAKVGYTVTATNNGTPVSTISCNPLSGSLFSVGNTPVICSATDGSGKTESSSFIISVSGIDNTPPTISPPPDVVATQSGTLTNVALGTPQVSDNADLSPLVTNDHPIAGFPTGVTTVTGTAFGICASTLTASETAVCRPASTATLTASLP